MRGQFFVAGAGEIVGLRDRSRSDAIPKLARPPRTIIGIEGDRRDRWRLRFDVIIRRLADAIAARHLLIPEDRKRRPAVDLGRRSHSNISLPHLVSYSCGFAYMLGSHSPEEEIG